jgi:hypothetical protein
LRKRITQYSLPDMIINARDIKRRSSKFSEKENHAQLQDSFALQALSTIVLMENLERVWKYDRIRFPDATD